MSKRRTERAVAEQRKVPRAPSGKPPVFGISLENPGQVLLPFEPAHCEKIPVGEAKTGASGGWLAARCGSARLKVLVIDHVVAVEDPVARHTERFEIGDMRRAANERGGTARAPGA